MRLAPSQASPLESAQEMDRNVQAVKAISAMPATISGIGSSRTRRRPTASVTASSASANSAPGIQSRSG